MTTPYYDSEDTKVQESGDPNPSNANVAAMETPPGWEMVDGKWVRTDRVQETKDDPRPKPTADKPRENKSPALKRFLFALLSNAAMTTEQKQELHDLLIVHFGEHDDDPVRVGTIGTNRSGSVRAEDAVPDPRDAMIANLRRELEAERAKNADG